jgi:methyltransferase (TIGR00027 family)
MSEPLIQNVSDTAFMVAVYRAMESERPDALFHDPLAPKLAGEHGQKIVDDMSGGLFRGRELFLRSRMVGWTVAIRTRIIDEFLQSAIAQGCDAVLNLGAGLDARPYRMALPASFHWIEADYPHVIEFKESRLAGETPRCDLERVKVDLADAEQRRRLFSQVSSRFGNVFVLTEGLVPYLSVDEAAGLADDIRAQSNFRAWAVDYFSPMVAKYRRRRGVQKKLQNAPFRFEPADYFQFFREHGWRVKEERYFVDVGAALGRPLPLPRGMRVWGALRGLFASRERKEAFRKFAGYVLFEPAVDIP